MCQTSEDILHNTLIKVMNDLSEISEVEVLNYIDYKFKMMMFQVKQDQKEQHKIIKPNADADIEQAN